MKKPGEELEFARGYCFVMPLKEGGHKLMISDRCPDDIRKKILEVWPVVERQTIERHRQGIYLEGDYFFE